MEADRRHTVRLGRARHSVIAIDPRAPEGAIFRRVGIEEFSEPGGFDHVVAMLSLHHVEDIGVALDKMSGLLRVGGTLIVVEFAWDRIDEKTAEWAPSHSVRLGVPLHTLASPPLCDESPRTQSLSTPPTRLSLSPRAERTSLPPLPAR